MGNCCSSNDTSNSYPLKNMGGGERATVQEQPIRTAGMTANTDEARAKRLAAAEERHQKAGRRGVQQGGGQLAKKLQDQQTSAGIGQGEIPANNLEWRVD